jgi:hypothetical protein
LRTARAVVEVGVAVAFPARAVPGIALQLEIAAVGIHAAAPSAFSGRHFASLIG